MILGNGKGGSTKRQEEGMVPVQVIHAALLPVPRETRLVVCLVFLCVLNYPLLFSSLALNIFFWQGCNGTY